MSVKRSFKSRAMKSVLAVFIAAMVVSQAFAEPAGARYFETEEGGKKMRTEILDEDNAILGTLVIGNETHVYNKKLAIELKIAGVEFTPQDLVDYSNDTNVPLMVEYGRQSFSGFGSFLAAVTDLTGLQIVRTDNVIVNNVRSAAASGGGELKEDYNTLPYVSVEQPAENVEEFVSQMPAEVKHVYVDSKMKVSLDSSVGMIKDKDEEPAVRDKYGNLDGSGMKIAIIDTGIDKTHPDLDDLDDDLSTNDPKVVAEYDFVGKSSVVRDGHGHGTHCSSIAAGTGEASKYQYVGVAPKATLLAAKALNDDGSGQTSDIVAAIEWAVDNGADIISMSLGCGPRCRNKPMEDAVDYAVQMGVTVVVAAGNDGSQMSTISTPGLVESAITVGAIDKNEQIAYFSSRGPTDDSLVKPDVVAPGVNICAASAGGSQLDGIADLKKCSSDRYFSISGTSMATPHVAGAAALLLQAHPDWMPSQVKAALVGTAKDLSWSKYVQGSGEVDVYDSVLTKVIVEPAVINIGLVTPGNTASSTFGISNVGSKSHGIRMGLGQVKLDDKNVGEVRHSFSKNEFCLQAGGKENVMLSLPTEGIELGIYSGDVVVSVFDGCDFAGASKDVRAPVGFSIINKVNMKYKISDIFSAQEYKFHDVYIIDKDTGHTENKIFYSDDDSDFFYTDRSKFDVLVVLDIINVPSPYYYGDKWKLSFITKGVDLGSSGETTLEIDEASAKDISTNVGDMLSSRDMNTYMVNTIIRMPTYTTGRGWFDSTPNQDYLSKEWRVAVNTNDAFRQDYELDIDVIGKERGVSFAQSKKLLVLPIELKNLATETSAVITDDQLRDVNMVFHDTPKYTDTIYFGINPFSDTDNLKWVLGLESDYPPSSKTITIRDYASCTRCSYAYALWYSDYQFETSFGLVSFDSKKLPVSIGLFGKPLNLDIQSQWDQIYSTIHDAEGNNIIYRIGTDSLEVTVPNGQKFSTTTGPWSLSCNSYYESNPNIGTCEIGDYKLIWKLEDTIKDRNYYMTATANYDGQQWTVKDRTTWDASACSLPGNPVCSPEATCSCIIDTCKSGWFRAELPTGQKLVKRFDSGKIVFNSGNSEAGYPEGEVKGIVSCLDDGKEFTANIEITSKSS